MADEKQEIDPQMNHDNLYEEELFTDRRVGSIQRLTPVTRDGGPDKSRPVLFVGQTQILTPAGTLPVTFEIDANSLGEAAKNFGDAAKTAIDETIEKLNELRREASSSIVLPEAGGGVPGGGKIQMP